MLFSNLQGKEIDKEGEEMRQISITKCGQCVWVPGRWRAFCDFSDRQPVMDICKKCIRRWQSLAGETDSRFILENGCCPVKRKVKYEISDCIDWANDFDRRLQELETKGGKK